jgi:acetylglutamate kinase
VTGAPSIVVKLGGEVVGAAAELAVLATDLAALARGGARIAIVHGGGAQATALQKRLGLEPRMVSGRRVTDAETLDVMKMVVAGKLNVDLCGALIAAGLRPVGLHGASGPLIRASRRPARVISGAGPEPIDLGLVGDVDGFDLPLIETLWAGGWLPVIATLGADPVTGQAYNINGDIVGNQLAAALRADKLLLVTTTPGVLADVRDPGTRIPHLTAAEARAAIADGRISGGMIPKIEESLATLAGGVGEIQILGRLAAGDLARAVESPGSVGTALSA